MITNMSLLCLIAVLGFASVHGQPFGVEPMQFEIDSLEAAKIKEDNYTGFVFDFDTEPVVTLGLRPALTSTATLFPS